jgi:cytoplasmic iron level regulating protein YaaA (DUF328/UPF0246 family)
MLAVISPAKTLDFTSEPVTAKHSEPEFMDAAAVLARLMANKKPSQLKSLMSISEQLASLNHARFQAWSRTPAPDAMRAALFAFKGDVYQGLDAATLKARDIDYAQSHLRILSGLYGLLRPLDLIQPYRLEMGTALTNPRGRSLYDYWGDVPARALAAQASSLRTRVLVNLASQEYFRAVDSDALGLDIVTPVFKDWSRGEYRILSFFAKRARGMMVRFLIERRCRKPAELLDFDSAGYAYDAESSTPQSPVFLRRLPGSDAAAV